MSIHFFRGEKAMQKKLYYDPNKIHRINLAIISVLAVLICGPMILSKG